MIATDLGFSAEAIENKVNGYKIKPGDVNGFKQKIEELWRSPKECEELGMYARRDYESKYMPEDNYKQLMYIYEDLRR